MRLNMSRIVAGGSVGTWLTLGYLLYLVAGIMGMAAWGGIYALISRTPNRSIFSDKLALAHFILYNLAVVGVTWPMGYAGFIGGSLLLAGKGVAEIHKTIEGLVLPIGVSVSIGVLSTIIGVINMLLSLMRESKRSEKLKSNK